MEITTAKHPQREITARSKDQGGERTEKTQRGVRNSEKISDLGAFLNFFIDIVAFLGAKTTTTTTKIYILAFFCINPLIFRELD
jgi:hypothetical protein